MNWMSAIHFTGCYDGFEEWEPEPEPPKGEQVKVLRVERWERFEAQRALVEHLRRKFEWKEQYGLVSRAGD
jgi:hypothetical protein